MKAIQVETYGSGYEQLHCIERPAPLCAPGQVVIRMRAAAINPLDRLSCQGKVQLYGPLPFIPGNEGVGIVSATTSDLPLGSRVMFTHGYALPDGGTWQEYVATSRRAVIALPDHVNEREAAALRVGFVTAYLALVEKGHVRPEHIVLVPGIGSAVGNACVQLGRILKTRVISTAGSHEKAERARSLGYTDIIDLSAETISAGIDRLTEGTGVDLVIDIFGGDFTRQALEVLTPGGTLVFVEASVSPLTTFSLHEVLGKNIIVSSLQVAWETEASQRRAFAAIFDLWTRGLITPAIDRAFDLSHAAEALRYQAEARPFGKVLLTME